MKKFKHDCNKCEFLGHYWDCDVYRCKESIIARFGNKRHEYVNGRIDIILRELFEGPKSGLVLMKNGQL